MIEVRNVSKAFKTGSLFRSHEVTALQDISFEIARGESVAFLGPNGAGKSTLIRILAGILRPSTGVSRIDGAPSGSRAASRKLGLIMGTRSQLWMHMTIRQNLDVIAEIYGLDRATRTDSLNELGTALGLTELLDRRARTLSLGQRMRCELACALLPRPEALLLDEPTIGLDLMSKLQFRELLRDWCGRRQTTILLTSHDISDISAIGRRTIIVRRGQVVFDGSVAQLRESVPDSRRVRVLLNDSAEPLELDFDSRVQNMREFLQNILLEYGERILDLQINEVPLDEVLQEHFTSGHA